MCGQKTNVTIKLTEIELQCDPLKFKYNFNHSEFFPRQI